MREIGFINSWSKSNIFLFNWIQILVCLGTQTLFSQSIPFTRHVIDLNFPGIQYIKIIDLDGDNDLDVVGGSEITPYSSSHGIAWWRNDGSSPINWTKFVIDSSFVHVMSVDAAYIDADSNLDIIASSWQLNQVAWWKNGGVPTQGWIKYIVQSGYGNAHDAQCEDIDEDGDIDIITASSNPGSIDICYNENKLQPIWNCVQIDPNFSRAKSVLIRDLDLDSDLDIVGTADVANDIAWWENTGINSQAWSKIIIENNFIGSCFANAIDINEDLKLDIIGSAWSSNQVAYWLCNDLSTNSWTKYSVTSSLQTSVRAFGDDFDKDGDIDLVAVGKSPGKLVVFINDHFNWTEQVLESNFEGGSALAIEDLDKDGDVDIIAGAGVLGDLYWWENETINTSVEDQTGLLQNNFCLKQNYPNPFNQTTKFSFTIPQRSNVSLIVYDVQGKVIRTILSEEKPPGNYEVLFDAVGLSSGIYYYQLIIDRYAKTNKIILMK